MGKLSKRFLSYTFFLGVYSNLLFRYLQSMFSWIIIIWGIRGSMHQDPQDIKHSKSLPTISAQPLTIRNSHSPLPSINRFSSGAWMTIDTSNLPQFPQTKHTQKQSPERKGSPSRTVDPSSPYCAPISARKKIPTHSANTKSLHPTQSNVDALRTISSAPLLHGVKQKLHERTNNGRDVQFNGPISYARPLTSIDSPLQPIHELVVKNGNSESPLNDVSKTSLNLDNTLDQDMQVYIHKKKKVPRGSRRHLQNISHP